MIYQAWGIIRLLLLAGLHCWCYHRSSSLSTTLLLNTNGPTKGIVGFKPMMGAARYNYRDSRSWQLGMMTTAGIPVDYLL